MTRMDRQVPGRRAPIFVHFDPALRWDVIAYMTTMLTRCSKKARPRLVLLTNMQKYPD